MAGVDRAPKPQDQQKMRQASLYVGHHTADPPVAAVVFAQRSGHGRGLDRGAHHAPLRQHPVDQ